ncbi:hypothetical protein [Sphingobium sp. YBL2]|uniref:hypothetical protein n=1 Tax=Sphingobium sp. (strain YBL2) TaxID=484429 RepID=UPI0005CC00E0|nr:hypothetical protein [Sphingobium sp. YBL2]AJR24528.1 hypothetical protein TZ53_13140 [Sphingobium sp. YBL2]
MADALTPRRFAEWHEDHRDVLWFRSPIGEPPYCGSPLDLGRAMAVEISIGREHFEFAPRDTGGWPFEQEDEPHLWWLPLPDAGEVQSAIDTVIAATLHSADCISFSIARPGPCDCGLVEARNG